MKKLVLSACILLCMTMLFGCSSGGETSAQSRTDLTSDHIRGLSVDMKRKDVEDLIGQDDDNLAQKEDIDIYSLSDGTTAVLRYVDDTLVSVGIRDKDMYEESIFNKFSRDIEDMTTGGETDETGETGESNDTNGDMDGNYDTENGIVGGETQDSGNGTDTNSINGVDDINGTGDTGNGTDFGTGNTNTTDSNTGNTAETNISR